MELERTGALERTRDAVRELAEPWRRQLRREAQRMEPGARGGPGHHGGGDLGVVGWSYWLVVRRAIDPGGVLCGCHGERKGRCCRRSWA